jgi:predicted DNA-binding transcriptional regulator AlpA
VSTLSPPARTTDAADPNELFCQDDAAHFLAVSPRTLEQWRVRGAGPRFVRLSRRAVRYRRRDLHDWIAERVVQPTSQPSPGEDQR